ncbi:MAG: hypothetical protein KGI37_11010 [Alphaproteobacteria bacterium]|nr:hypothetical protein [Alphaproteobacteria bacterium]
MKVFFVLSRLAMPMYITDVIKSVKICHGRWEQNMPSKNVAESLQERRIQLAADAVTARQADIEKRMKEYRELLETIGRNLSAVSVDMVVPFMIEKASETVVVSIENNLLTGCQATIEVLSSNCRGWKYLGSAGEKITYEQLKKDLAAVVETALADESARASELGLTMSAVILRHHILYGGEKGSYFVPQATHADRKGSAHDDMLYLMVSVDATVVQKAVDSYQNGDMPVDAYALPVISADKVSKPLPSGPLAWLPIMAYKFKKALLSF